MARWRAYLELMRLSNLPTVWSNVLMGVVVGGWATRLDWLLSLEGERRPPLFELSAQLAVAWPFLLAASFFYLGGMALNDALDAQRDAVDDPRRPIPSGRITRREALVIAVILLAGGLAATWVWTGRPSQIAALALVGAIVAYNLLHHTMPASRLLMGVCRGLLVVYSASWVGATRWAPWWGVVLGVAVLVTFYTWSISAVAARESQHGDTRRKLVMRMIAGMPLLDAAILLALGLWWPASGVCVLCALLTALGHRRIAGT